MPAFSKFGRRLGGLFVLLGVFVASAAAAPPDAPMVTAGADIKQLQFDWQIVPRSNYYELWFKADNGSSPARLSEQVPWRPRALTRVSAHLLDWQQARYIVKACNPSGCGQSAPLAVEDLMFDAVGYFKPSQTRPLGAFGVAMTLSEDGQTMAVVANGDPSTGADQHGTVAVYVFAKSGSQWRQQARLVPNPSNLNNGETPAISLSGNGNVLALGLLAADPIGPAPSSVSGSVYVFRRTGTTWIQQQRIDRRPADSFLGYITRLDEAGNTLLVVSASQGGTAKVYKYALGIWNLSGSVPGPGGGTNCNAITLSGDGLTIARTCRWPQGTAMKLQLFTGSAWTMSEVRPLTTHAPDYEIYEIATSYDAGIISAAEFPTGNEADQFPSVHVIDRLRGTSDALTPYWPCLDQWRSAFGRNLAVSRDGTFIAVSDPADKCVATGSHRFNSGTGPQATGAVYIFQHHSSGSWPYRRVLKANNSLVGNENFSGALAFAENGKTFAVAQVGDNSAATGINGDRTDNSKVAAGAVWLY